MDLTVSPAHSYVYPRTEWTISAFAFRAIIWPTVANSERMKGWVGLGITIVSKQSAHKCYTMNTTAAVSKKQDLYCKVNLSDRLKHYLNCVRGEYIPACSHFCHLDINPRIVKCKGDLGILKMYLHTEHEVARLRHSKILNGGWDMYMVNEKIQTQLSRSKVKVKCHRLITTSPWFIFPPSYINFWSTVFKILCGQMHARRRRQKQYLLKVQLVARVKTQTHSKTENLRPCNVQGQKTFVGPGQKYITEANPSPCRPLFALENRGYHHGANPVVIKDDGSTGLTWDP